MKWGYFSAYGLDPERALLLPVSISVKIKAIRSQFRVLGTGKYPPSSGKSSQSCSKSPCAKGGLSCSFSLKVNWGYISTQKIDTERPLLLPESISVKVKAIRSYFRVPGTGKYPPSSGKSSQSCSKSQCAEGVLGYSFSLKESRAIFRPRSPKQSLRSFQLCQFQ